MKIRWYCNIRSWSEIVIKLYSIKCSMLHCFVQGDFVMFFSCGWPRISLGTSASTSRIKTRSVRKRVKQVHAQPCVIKPWPHTEEFPYENPYILMRFRLSSTLKRPKTLMKTEETGQKWRMLTERIVLKRSVSDVNRWKQGRKKVYAVVSFSILGVWIQVKVYLVCCRPSVDGRSVGIIGWRTGSGREKGKRRVPALSFSISSLPYSARRPPTFSGYRPHWPRAWNRLKCIKKYASSYAKQTQNTSVGENIFASFSLRRKTLCLNDTGPEIIIVLLTKKGYFCYLSYPVSSRYLI